MITGSNRVVPLALTALAVTLPLAACGSSRSPAATTTTAAAATKAQQTCGNVAAVLSDGPDSGTDPVGYAEAQIAPLRQIHPANPTLSNAITALANDYSSYYTANGKGSSVNSALNTAINKINALCPGAGATT
jgi:hypothetical protein